MDLVVVFIVGLLVACLINLAAYRLRTFEPRGYSPWNGLANGIASLLGSRELPTVPDSPTRQRKEKGKKSKKPQAVAKRTWLDTIPILGWWRISREEQLHGKGFWIQPLLFELIFPIFLVWLYSWQVLEQQTIAYNIFPSPFQTIDVFETAFVSSFVLIVFMAVVSLIDLDEYEIPDVVIIPGTILGVALVTTLKSTPLLTVTTVPLSEFAHGFQGYVDFNSPNAWPTFLTQDSLWSLLIGIGCVVLWSFALMPRFWRTSRGYKFACVIFFERLRRERMTWILLALGVAGSLAVWALWQFADAATWKALLTSLLGMAIGMIIIWSVRIVAGIVTGREAMGFGDVTLFGMIGAFLGWQACVFTFFVSPFFALVPALASAIMRRTTEHHIPYGPFLAMGAVGTIVFWRKLWEGGSYLFAVSGLLPIVLLLCIPVLAILLGLWRFVAYLLTRNKS